MMLFCSCNKLHIVTQIQKITFLLTEPRVGAGDTLSIAGVD
jgi:hypothetical protein